MRAVEENLAKEKSDVKAPEATIEPDEDAAKRPKNVISKLDDLDFYAKLKAVQLNPETTISSIVRDLVFHDKVIYLDFFLLLQNFFSHPIRAFVDPNLISIIPLMITINKETKN